MIATIGSRLKMVTLNVHDLISFLKAVVSERLITKLPIVTVASYGFDEDFPVAFFNKLLPRVHLLEKLNLELHNNEISLQNVIEGFRNNGSICSMSIICPGDDLALNISNGVAPILAFCRRNQELAVMLKRIPGSCPWSHTTVSEAFETTPSCLFPTLLQLAKQVPRNRISVIWNSLVHFGDGLANAAWNDTGFCPL